METYRSDRPVLEGSPAFRKITYDIQRYDFRSWAQEALGVVDLSRLHLENPFGPCHGNDRSLRARWNTALMRKLPELEAVLGRFIGEELSAYFVDVPEVRHPPLFRIHPPGWDSISPLHRDSEYGLAVGATNVWIPLTRVWGSNSLWLESHPDRGDLRAVELDYGEALVFDAVRLTHGSRTNTTNSTRVSFDFRCHGRLQKPTAAG